MHEDFGSLNWRCKSLFKKDSILLTTHCTSMTESQQTCSYVGICLWYVGICSYVETNTWMGTSMSCTEKDYWRPAYVDSGSAWRTFLLLCITKREEGVTGIRWSRIQKHTRHRNNAWMYCHNHCLNSTSFIRTLVVFVQCLHYFRCCLNTAKRFQTASANHTLAYLDVLMWS